MRDRIRTTLMSLAVMATAAAGTGLAPTPTSAAVAAPVTLTPAAQATLADSGFTMEPANVGAQAAGYVRNKATNRCLEQGFGGAVGHVFTSPCNYGPAQTWTWVGGGNYRSLVNSWSQECLDGTSATGSVYTLACNGGDYQKWRLFDTGHIIQWESDQALDSNWEGSVYLSPINQGDYQKWY
ncbi:RICIN domain-containing protein [Nonomuraea rhodomycinica]|uniref:Ricin-type beta-trefoil lectin domain protein n=1 Tax=Nonomuraea rhodomycinica TaxID=1712872 RepID=A0A7Y6IPB7_9ACTN|nr:ricin-type beta-trefoil lectin domain protein [Nonomuraea rhodomycinica]NUW40629.1 ricin-type beta-trefoil lectin domain protein [Nonomuraea rhodomycinica]